MPFTVPYTLKPVTAPTRTLSKGSSSDDGGLQSPRSAWSRTSSLEDNNSSLRSEQPPSAPGGGRGGNEGSGVGAWTGASAPGGESGDSSTPLQHNAAKGKLQASCSFQSEEGGTTHAQNSGPAEGEKRADDAGGSDPKDVEKERHYNSFMEARLKLGQTRTVAEPLLRLKARQQEPPPPQITRRGSTPIFSQAMLRRPSERRLSGVKAKVASGGSPSEIDGVTSAHDVSDETAATPGATRKTSSPTKSPRSSPSKTTSMSIASTTVVTTLGDLSRRDSATPAGKPVAPVTTLRITRKPSVGSASAKKTETSDATAEPDCAAKQPLSPPANDVKKPMVAENKASELRKASSPPKKAASTVTVRRKSQPLRIRTSSVTVEESGTTEPKPTTTAAEQQLPPKAASGAPPSGSVSKVGEKSGNAEKLCNATSGNEAKASSLDANGAAVPVSKTKASSFDANSALPPVNHVDASLPDRKDTANTAPVSLTTKLKESHNDVSKRSGLEQISTSEQSAAVKHTDVPREKISAVLKDQSDSKTDKQDVVPASNKSVEQRESAEEKKREDKIQTVDIRDLRILLRTPSPLPPKSSSPTSRGSSSTTPTITRLDSGGSRKGSFSSLASRNGSCDGPEDVSEASTSGVSSLSGFRRDSLASSRPSSLSWDSDAALSSTATSTPSDAVGGVSLRSRSVSVESAADAEEACPRGWSSHVHSRLSAGSHGARRARQPPPTLRHNNTPRGPRAPASRGGPPQG
ncbi:hypothetical protein V5799_022901 [Amblyomma americanum]|uniref:Uncharacterized protein n=1 Tax=Amblyomma americanum TaxID=6943 RepID=A0AAQ4FLF2_AMBAM